jgi:hypothetical protein
MALRSLTDSTTAIPRWRLTRWRATATDVRILDGVDEYLFMGGELRLALEAQAQKMREAVEAEPEENLKQADPLESAAALAHHFAVACPELNTDEVWMEEPRPVKIDVSRDPGRYFSDPYSDLARNYPGERIVVHVPFKGDAGVFKLRPSAPVRLGFGLHHLPAGTRFRLGRLRCLAYGGSPIAHAGRGWYRAAALERAAFERLASGGEIDLLFCHDPRTLEQGTHGSRPLRSAGRETPPSGRLLRAPAPPARERHRTARTRRARILPARKVLGRSAR